MSWVAGRGSALVPLRFQSERLERSPFGTTGATALKAIFTGDDPGLRAAAAFIDTLGANAAFWDGILGHGPFDFATISPDRIIQRLQAEGHAITVVLWHPRAPRRKFYANTVAVTNPKEPYVLHYHTAFLTNSVGQKVNTIIHEYIHNIDDHDGDPGEQMGHGDNDWRGKDNSPPYWIGGFAQKLWEAGQVSAEPAAAPATPVVADVFADEAVAAG
jgi:hypothetical protein